ncbi:MAG: diaminopimelate epimerase [Calditrichaeota bacterium]|nr:diaminopimelate epimerase [Calditrichota bacterium]
MINFIKFSATGNDFIAIDNQSKQIEKKNPAFFERICKRRTGIGADGVLMVEPSDRADFRMVYINADGHEAEMCANGARAISYFAFHQLKLSKSNQLQFETMNSLYRSTVFADDVELQMTELSEMDSINIADLLDSKFSMYLNTGVPHCVYQLDEIDELDVEKIGRNIRYEKRFKNGTNVNFVKLLADKRIRVRTYERGVEAETLSCGTGVTASALAISTAHNFQDELEIETRGGKLTVRFDENFKTVYLRGAVHEIYHGSFNP